MRTKQIIYTICLIIGCLITIVSCKKDEIKDSSLPYIFRPIKFAVETNKTVATITWAPVDSATSYTIQISQDSLLFQNIIISDSITSTTYVVELAGSTRYSARVKANARNPQRNSKYNESITFKTPAENIFLGFSSYMNGQGSVAVSWLPGSNVTKLVFSAPGKTDVQFDISNDEKISGKKLCTGLANGNYTVAVYNNQYNRGLIKLTVEGDVWVQAGDALSTALNAITMDSAVVIIKPGVYSIGGSAYSLTKNIKIKGLYQDSLPIICMTGASTTAKMLEISNSNRINFIRFENIEFSGYLDGLTSGAKIGYIFNQSNGCNIGELSFTNCVMRNLGNTPIRMQTTALKTIDNLLIDKCIIFDIGYASVYALVNLNAVGSGYINNISFTNSTIYNFAGSLIVHNSSNSNSVLVQNCTFNEITTSGTGTAIRYFIDYTATYSVVNSVTIQNCIFGSTPRPYTEGIRVSPTTNKQISGSYCTSDFKDNNAATGSASIMGNLTLYPGLSTDLFVAPVSGNFSFKDNSFVGRKIAGDPRWWPAQ
jgi:hypothetical protein